MSCERSSLCLPTQCFLVLLRLAIGWHFLYEGWSKLETYQAAAPGNGWSAAGYLQHAEGPLASYYRRLLDDPDGVERLTPADDAAEQKQQEPLPGLVRSWEDYLKGFQTHYQLTDPQKEQAGKLLEKAKKTAAENYVRHKAYITDYLAALKKHRADDARNLAPFEKDRHYGEQLKGIQAQRNWAMGKVNEWTGSFQAGLESLLTAEQRELGRPKPNLNEYRPLDSWDSWKALDWINFATVYGLIGMGLCLMLGLFTRLAALGAAIFLASLYLAMPPWPGLPGTSAMGGHYFFVNLQLIELIAVLAVAGSGRWAGIDAIIYAIFFGNKKAVSRRGAEIAEVRPPSGRSG